uniref:Uncharacterized protein n=1 Tax=Calcidiscus leptoporus TaxID=127549 RepID=A0A7S0IX55_9EUKA|mmetsp:Transcript_27653/g.64535  ORF Transcript_27653/g.64535 Transcript_27653/m.64535 type:complete len:232 (+) Transcript_27653:94-789(+)
MLGANDMRRPLTSCLAACLGPSLPKGAGCLRQGGASASDKDKAATCISVAWRKHSSGRSTTPTVEEKLSAAQRALTASEKHQLAALLGGDVDATTKELLSDGSVARRRAAIRRRFDQKMQGRTQQQRRVIARSLFASVEHDDSSDVDSIADEADAVVSPACGTDAFPIPQYIEAPSPRTPSALRATGRVTPTPSVPSAAYTPAAREGGAMGTSPSADQGGARAAERVAAAV